MSKRITLAEATKRIGSIMPALMLLADAAVSVDLEYREVAMLLRSAMKREKRDRDEAEEQR